MGELPQLGAEPHRSRDYVEQREKNRARRLARYQEVHRLRREGESISGIARALKMHRETVRRTRTRPVSELRPGAKVHLVSPEAVELIRLIKQAQDLGFPLDTTGRVLLAELAAEEMRISREYVARRWQEYTSESVLPEDLSVSEPGMTTVLEIARQTGGLRISHDARAQEYLNLSYPRETA